MKPFIQLFSSAKYHYFYEVNRNEVKRISDSAYNSIQEVLKGNLTLSDIYSTNDDCKKMIDAGYLSVKRPSVVEHISTQSLHDQQKTNVKMMALQLTQNCNFRCNYCPYSGSTGDKQRKHSKLTMNIETAKSAINFFYDHSQSADPVVLGFYGGEPLLEFGIMKECVSYAKEVFAGRNLHFNITTNASLLSNEVVDYLVDNHFNILISIDGPKEVHDKNRRLAVSNTGTFDLVITRIENAIKRRPEIKRQLSYNMVVDPKNDADCTKSLFINYDFITMQNAHSTLVDTLFLEDNQFDATEDFCAKLEYHKALAFLREYKNINPETIMPLALTGVSALESDIERFTSTELGDVASPGGPCIPGVTRLFVDVGGQLFPCERCSEQSSIMNIGSIYEGFNYEKSNVILNVAQIGAEDCKNCWAIYKCSICAAQIENGDSFSLEKRKQRCNSVRFEATSFILDKIMLYEIQEIERKRHLKGE